MEESSGLLGGRGGWSRRTTIIIGVSFAAWNLLIFILAVVAVSKERSLSQEINHIYNQSVTIPDSFTAKLPYSTFFPVLVQPSKVVSLDIEGHLTLGGGTSIYRDIETYATDGNVINHLEVKALSEHRIILYHDGSMITGDLDPRTNIITWHGPEKPLVDGDPKKVFSSRFIVLSETLAIAIVQTADTDGLIPVSIDDKTGEVTPHTMLTFTGGVDPKITRLSDTAFAISYITGSPAALNTAYGWVEVDAQGVPKIDLGTAAQYDASDHHHEIAGMTYQSWLVSYPATTNRTNGYNPIVVRYVSLNSDKTVKIGPETILEYSATSFPFDVEQVAENRAIIVFVDSFQNYDLRAVSVTLSNTNLIFGSSLVLNSGGVVGPEPTDYKFLSVSTLVSDTILVTYSDHANDGRITATLVDLTDASDLIQISPNYVISQPDPAGASGGDHYWVTSAAINSHKFIIIDHLDGGDFQGASINIGHIKGRPIGVVKGRAGTRSEIYTSGTAYIVTDEPLLVGQRYYTTTHGDLITQGNIDSLLDLHPDQYIVNNNTIVSLNSYVGIAISETQIALKA